MNVLKGCLSIVRELEEAVKPSGEVVLSIISVSDPVLSVFECSAHRLIIREDCSDRSRGCHRRLFVWLF